MSEIQTQPVVPSRETSQSYEPLTEERLGDFLAAIGNHEAKALVLSAMEPDEAYGKRGMHRLFLHMQGEKPTYTGSAKNQLGYCMHSFEPIGAVAKVRDEGGILKYEITEDGETKGKGLAGHLLNLSLEHPEISLRGIFGMTKTTSATEERPPIRRLHIMERLLHMQHEGESLTAVGLSEKLDFHFDIVKHHLKSLAAAGALEFDSLATTDEDRATYIPTSRITRHTYNSNPSLIREAVNVINRGVQAGRESLTLDEIEAQLRELPKYQNHTGLRGNTTIVLRDLIEQGLLKKGRFGGNQASEISLSTEQQALLEHVVGIARKFQMGNTEFVQQGRTLAAQIISNPSDVKTLVEKAYSNSPEANGVERHERVARMTHFIVANEVATTNEIVAAMAPYGITKSSVKTTLASMRKAGQLESVRINAENAWAFSRSSH